LINKTFLLTALQLSFLEELLEKLVIFRVSQYPINQSPRVCDLHIAVHQLAFLVFWPH